MQPEESIEQHRLNVVIAHGVSGRSDRLTTEVPESLKPRFAQALPDRKHLPVVGQRTEPMQIRQIVGNPSPTYQLGVDRISGENRYGDQAAVRFGQFLYGPGPAASRKNLNVDLRCRQGTAE